jgi:nicotinamide-nucleotide amidase
MKIGRRPRVEIVSTGTEILQGLYADTNAQWLSSRLLAMGLPVSYHSAAGDSLVDLENHLQTIVRRCDLLIISGGLGPTEDDINRYAIARMYNRELVENATVVEQMRERFARRSLVFNESNRIQAMIPEGAQVFYNEWGTAPGFLIEGSDCVATLVALPGPPRELRPMFERWVQPYLIERFRPSERHLVLTIHTIDLPESEINAKLQGLYDSDPMVNIGLLAEQGKVDIRLTAHGSDEDKVRRALGEIRCRIEERVGSENIYGVDDETLESAVAELLKSRQLTISVAESCTGGMITSRLANVAGASSYLLEGFVTYTNEAKIARLGVERDLIEQYGAVSRQVARAMAEGVRRVTQADLGLSATGIAGPTGGTAEKPVGLVYVGLAWGNDSVVVERRFLGNRNENRIYSTNVALDLVRRHLLRESKR